MKQYLEQLFLTASESLSYLRYLDFIIEVPKNEDHGDLSANAAFLLSKALKRNPREIAAEIVKHLPISDTIIEKIEIAGPGFINFFFTHEYKLQIIQQVLSQKDQFGRSTKYAGKTANVEFVSANPTGPLTVGHGRNSVIGDIVANLLASQGYSVTREYYFNNAGRQMRVLGDSIRLRYLELLGDQVTFPDEYYQGGYIIDIAKSLLTEYGDSLKNEPAEGVFKERAEKEIFADIKGTLERLGVKHDVFYNEHSLYEEGRIDQVLSAFRNKGIAYKYEGAEWLMLASFANRENKVIVKSSGEPTYRLPDIAYHITKFERGYDLMVDLFGSDHTDTVPDVLASVRLLGYEPERVKVLIHQFVTILQDGKVVKISTRKANYVTLDDLIEWVGADVVRYFFAMRSISSHMNFDLDLAKKQSDENPVFYMQYAHARICSILRMTAQENLAASTENLALLSTPEEVRLMKKLMNYEEEVWMSARNFDIPRLCNYLEDLAATFHRFYTVCRIMGSEKNLAEARIALVEAVRITMQNGLSILGVSAPEKM